MSRERFYFFVQKCRRKYCQILSVDKLVEKLIENKKAGKNPRPVSFSILIFSNL